ncbi:hypothetical protein BH11MYX2_BH11MYX2_29240 [soil metagenome]
MRVVASVVFVAALASSALADPKADAAYAEGQRLYTAGRYIDAAEKFESAYALNPDPAYLFNVAQSYRLGNACAKSANAYRLFLPTVIGAAATAKTQGYIDQMEACAREQAVAEPTVVEPTRVPDPVDYNEPLPPPPAAHRTPWLAITVVGVGVAGLAVGVLAR